MEKGILNKYNRLKEYLQELGSASVAFSGGVDSSLLLFAAKEALGKNTTAVIAKSVFIPEEEYEEAIAFANKYDIRHEVLEVDILGIKEIKENNQNRCYICKKNIFEGILKKSHEMGHSFVLEGSNMDDLKDYRPGARAIKELGVKSPLQEVQLFKSEIREILKELGLKAWNKPSMACLASRFAYGEALTTEGLKRTEEAERFLFGMGYGQLRVRNHGRLARIEVEEEELTRIIKRAERKKIYEEFIKLGYDYVTLDMEGYRMGSMNLNTESSHSHVTMIK